MLRTGILTVYVLYLAFHLNYADVLRFDHGNREKQPPLWQEVPFKISQFPTTPETGTMVDPWNYRDRLGLLRILLRKTKQYQRFGKDNSANPLWGFALQLGWQYSSQRLANSTDKWCRFEKEACISSFSWWSGINYYLSVLPFLGAYKAGYFNDWPVNIAIFYPTFNAHLFCVDSTSCDIKAKEALLKWTTYFHKLKVSKNEDEILAYQWDAHSSSLQIALLLMKDLDLNLADRERKFGLDWAHFVQYIAAAYRQPDLNTTYDFQEAYLPKVSLTDDTTVPKSVGRGLQLLHNLWRLDYYTNNRVLNYWKRITCSHKARLFVNEVISSDFDNSWRLPWDLAKLTWISLWEKCDRPL